MKAVNDNLMTIRLQYKRPLRITFEVLNMSQEQSIPSAQLLDRFCVAGVNYQGADTALRGTFAVSAEAFAAIAAQAKVQGIRSVFTISTCNRTEIYGFADSVHTLINLLLPHTQGTATQFLECAYIKTGEAAMQHLFRMASGLDSQILGDYEILGQLKQSIAQAKGHDTIGPVMDRILNHAIGASKKVKTHTRLSSGTVSVSYAAIELLQALPHISGKKILVIGAGKFGSNVCRNLRQYLPETAITITNRTNRTALQLAEAAGLQYLPYEDLQQGAQDADILIVCTNAPNHTIRADFFRAADQKLILDLSVPVNADPILKTFSGMRVVDIDEISTTILDRTLSQRRSEVPQAEAILSEAIAEYISWLNEYRYSLHLKQWKSKLRNLPEQAVLTGGCEMAASYLAQNPDLRVQKAVSKLAVNLRTSEQKGCQFINAVNDYLEMK